MREWLGGGAQHSLVFPISAVMIQCSTQFSCLGQAESSVLEQEKVKGKPGSSAMMIVGQHTMPVPLPLPLPLQWTFISHFRFLNSYWKCFLND